MRLSDIKEYNFLIEIIGLIIGIIGITITIILSIKFSLDYRFIIGLLIFLLVISIILSLYLSIKLKNLKNQSMCLKKIGFECCTEELKDTNYDPRIVVSKCGDSNLDFMGVCGTKWLYGDGTKKSECMHNFEKMLKRARANSKKVRFLMIDEKYDFYKHMKKDRGEDICAFQDWRRLLSDYSDILEVRCYNHAPTFRIMILDDIAVISTYNILGRENDDRGWGSPNMVFKQTMDSSFKEAIIRLFESEWQFAKKLSD